MWLFTCYFLVKQLCACFREAVWTWAKGVCHSVTNKCASSPKSANHPTQPKQDHSTTKSCTAHSTLQLENREEKYTHDWKVRSISKETALDDDDKAAAIITAFEQGKGQPSRRPTSQLQNISPSQLLSFHHCFNLLHCKNSWQFVPLTSIKAFLPALDKDISLTWTSSTLLLLLPRNTKGISTAAAL